MKRRISALLIAALLLGFLPGACAAGSASFRDVPENVWYAGSVAYCVQHGLFSGTSARTFSPGVTMNRAMLVTVLCRLAGTPASTGTAPAFGDVSASDWYAPALAWAGEKGYVTGYSDGSFRPRAAVTREQFVSILYRYAAGSGLDTANSGGLSAFSDAESVSPYALDAVRWAVGTGLLTGNGGELRPAASSTRAQIAAILTRFAKTYSLTLPEAPAAKTPFETYGALHVSGNHLAGSGGETVQLRGVSTHGLAWYPQYVNADTFQTLRDEWGCNVVRLAMYTAEYGGYCVSGSAQQSRLKALIDTGVQAASSLGMYVIIDWHILSDGNPNTHLSEARAFFAEMAKKYGSYGNVLYEICNEPNSGTTWKQIKSYAAGVLPAIRQYDPDGVVLVGTPTWSQDVDQAAADPITGDANVMYTLHFYAATHREALRSKLEAALKSGLPVFVSEFGICDASGSGSIDAASANTWLALLDKYSVSWCCWNLSNKNEASALLSASSSALSDWSAGELSREGTWLLKVLDGSAGSGASAGSSAASAGSTGESSSAANAGTDASGSTSAGSISSSQSGTCTASAAPGNSWSDGGKTFYQYAVTVKNSSEQAVDTWSVRLSFSGAVALSGSWCGTFSVSGSTVTVTPADYNGALSPGGTAQFGLIVSGAPLSAVSAG